MNGQEKKFVPRLTVPDRADRLVIARALVAHAHLVSQQTLQYGGIENMTNELGLIAALMAELVNQANAEIMEELGTTPVPDDLSEYLGKLSEGTEGLGDS